MLTPNMHVTVPVRNPQYSIVNALARSRHCSAKLPLKVELIHTVQAGQGFVHLRSTYESCLN